MGSGRQLGSLSLGGVMQRILRSCGIMAIVEGTSAHNFSVSHTPTNINTMIFEPCISIYYTADYAQNKVH